MNRVTDEMVHRLALHFEQKRTHPVPRTLLEVPLNRRQRVIEEAREALAVAVGGNETP